MNTIIHSKITRLHRRTTARAAPQTFKKTNYLMFFDEIICLLLKSNAIIYLRT